MVVEVTQVILNYRLEHNSLLPYVSLEGKMNYSWHENGRVTLFSRQLAMKICCFKSVLVQGVSTMP